MARILVVDDEIESCKMLEEFLCSKGYDVSWALNTDEAIKIVKTKKPHLVLLELRIPVIPATHSGRKRPPVGAKRRWALI